MTSFFKHNLFITSTLIATFILLLPVVNAAPSAEQIKLFKGLPKAQQEKLMQQQGINTSSLKTHTPQKPIQTTPTVKPISKQEIEQETKMLAKKTTTSILKPKLTRFGASLFAGKPSTFSPVNDIPIPTDYILGPGDQLNIQLYGNKNETYQLVVDRNGKIAFPELGPVSIAGQTLSQAKADLTSKIGDLGIGVNANITLGELRSFRIFVLGESRAPGSYLVSGMATITHALYVSGGISNIGSFRKIQLKRKGKLIATLDLYDLLLRGDTKNDIRLQAGDSVFIPVTGKTISIAGSVNRPAIYEIKNERYFKDILKLSGGPTPSAFLQKTKVTRLTNSGFNTVKELNLTRRSGLNSKIRNGDYISIANSLIDFKNTVTITGNVHRPGQFAWHKGLRLKDLLSHKQQFKADADLTFIVVLRQTENGSDYQVLNTSWEKDNLPLASRDKIYIFSRTSKESREITLNKVTNLLNEQASVDNPPKVIAISGLVKYPGNYPLADNTSIADAILAAGGLKYQALMINADVIRYQIINGQQREVENITLNLQKALAGDKQHNIALLPFDRIIVKQVSDWSDASREITLEGEVLYPGNYTIRPGETLEDVLKRAGGFSQWAEPKNSVFLRESLKIQEQKELSFLADNMEKNLLLSVKRDASLFKGDQVTGILTMGQTLIERIRNTPALGRLVIGLDRKNDPRYDATMKMELKNGDRLIVPKKSYEVLVTGEVSRSASTIYVPGKTLDEYLQVGGGMTNRADNDAIYVVHGDGSIEKYNDGGWFGAENDIAILAGDTIVVPADIDTISPFVAWTSVSKILANFAITAATLKTVGVVN